MEYKPQDAMFSIDCNGEYVKNPKTLIIVRCRHFRNQQLPWLQRPCGAKLKVG